MDTWASDRGETTVESLVHTIAPWLMECDGITISGGEPFDQPEALSEFLRQVRLLSPANILVFSGYAIEDIGAALGRLEGKIDALITDPFQLHARQTLALRGSDNQRLHLLTDLGSAMFASYERPACRSDRALDVMIDPDGSIWFAGIPARGDFRRLRLAMQEHGHEVEVSEDRVHDVELTRADA